MDEIDKILYALGYYDSDPLKRAIVGGYIAEAEEYMTEAGVPADKLKTQRAFAIKNIWADARDKNELETAIKKDGMIAHLVSQLRR
jgi:hypothetical protein